MKYLFFILAISLSCNVDKEKVEKYYFYLENDIGNTFLIGDSSLLDFESFNKQSYINQNLLDSLSLCITHDSLDKEIKCECSKTPGIFIDYTQLIIDNYPSICSKIGDCKIISIKDNPAVNYYRVGNLIHIYNKIDDKYFLTQKISGKILVLYNDSTNYPDLVIKLNTEIRRKNVNINSLLTIWKYSIKRKKYLLDQNILINNGLQYDSKFQDSLYMIAQGFCVDIPVK